MRRQAVLMIISAVLMTIALLGLPLTIWAGYQNWLNQQNIEQKALMEAVYVLDNTNGQSIDDKMMAQILRRNFGEKAAAFTIKQGNTRVIGKVNPQTALDVRQAYTSKGQLIMLEVDSNFTWTPVAATVSIAGLVTLVTIIVGIYIANRGSRRLSDPLIYLAAAAEQIGSGQVRPKLKPSGIEEIDLVQREMNRSADRMAGRVAAERQFAAQASHQLRTPLTALSMRLEEIGFLTDDAQVQGEAQACIEQVDRLTEVVQTLLTNANSKGGGQAEAVPVWEVISKQALEWEPAFKAKGRELKIADDLQVIVVATPGSLSQVLATIIENSLKYGEGTLTISTSYSSADHKGARIDISDEGPGVSDELGDSIFLQHVSGHGSTGIGLALAKELVEMDGGRLELTQRRPPIFTVFLNVLPARFNPDLIMPQGLEVMMDQRSVRRW